MAGDGSARSARSAALGVLVRVDAGAYAAPLLDRALGGLERREERALCTELVFGCLRWQGELDYALEGLLRRPVAHLPAAVRVALRLGAYQILHLDRVPNHAAVSSSVELAREGGAPALTGLVNGVLRGLARTGRRPAPSDDVACLSVTTSHPPWLVASWLTQYGREDTLRLLEHDNEAPAVTLRVADHVGRERFAARLRAVGVDAEPTQASRYGLRLRHGTAVTTLPGYREGLFIVQDEGAMLAVEWLGARPGERVVDACAGRGTKTLGLVDVVGPSGTVLAVDRHAGKLQALRREAGRRGIGVVTDPTGAGPGLVLRAADARQLARLVGPDGARSILLDAPCTGLGVLRRRPELRWRRRQADADALRPLQVALLEAAVDALAPGGSVLYVTCSTDPRENEEVVERVLATRSGVRSQPVCESLPDLPALRVGPFGSVRLFGPTLGADSFFYARLERTDEPARTRPVAREP